MHGLIDIVIERFGVGVVGLYRSDLGGVGAALETTALGHDIVEEGGLGTGRGASGAKTPAGSMRTELSSWR